MNEVIRALISRRSVRSYNDKKVPAELVKEIVEAGTYAPSGSGSQASKMVVIRDETLVKELSQMNAAVGGMTNDPFYGAKTIVVVFSDSQKATCVENGALVMANLMNAAYSVGVCSCWIHRAREVFETDRGKSLKEKWGVPSTYIGIGHCILGYSDMPIPEAAPRKEDYYYFA